MTRTASAAAPHAGLNTCVGLNSNAPCALFVASRCRPGKPEDAAEILHVVIGCSYLPQRSVVESCEFHTDRGCNLPAEMRADMCNHYICPALHEMRSSLEQDEPAGFFIAAADGELKIVDFVPPIGQAELQLYW